MSNPHQPLGRYEWVPPSGRPQGGLPPRPQRPKRSDRRWKWIFRTSAALFALVLVTGGLSYWREFDTRNERSDDAPAGSVGTPDDLLISMPLDRQPVPGWRKTAADLGLPPGVGTGSMFASINHSAFFIAGGENFDGSDPRGFVYGVDARTGETLFTPIEMPGFRVASGDCFGNGPAVAVCVSDGNPEHDVPRSVWIIDLVRGSVKHNGPTNLRRPSYSGPEPHVQPVGNALGQTYLLGVVANRGIHGIGDRGELTWFRPGSGELSIPNYLQSDDIPPLTIAVQVPSWTDANQQQQVFSVTDGTDLTPTPPPGLTLDKAVVYNGGFAYQFQEPTKSAGVLFYDSNGNAVGRQQIDGTNLLALDNSVGTPVLWQQAPSRWNAYSTNGELKLSIPAQGPVTDFKTIGTKLYVQVGGSPYAEDARWQQWDLLTGRSGPICNIGFVNLHGIDYVGSDGTNVLSNTDLGRGTVSRATNMTTCEVMWETSPVQGGAVWKVGTGSLIQRTGDDITQLVAQP